MVINHAGLHGPVRTRWARRPGRQFSLTYWNHFDSAFPPGNPGASYRSAVAPTRGRSNRSDRAGGTGGTGGSGGGSEPVGLGPTPAPRGRLARALDLIGTGLRFGAPWAWTVYPTPVKTTPRSPHSRVPNGAGSNDEGWN